MGVRLQSCPPRTIFSPVTAPTLGDQEAACKLLASGSSLSRVQQVAAGVVGSSPRACGKHTTDWFREAGSGRLLSPFNSFLKQLLAYANSKQIQHHVRIQIESGECCF